MKRFHSPSGLAAFLLIFLLYSPAAIAAPDVAQAQQFVLDGVSRVSRILRAHSEPRETIAEKLRAEFRRGFDVAAIASFALGPRAPGFRRSRSGSTSGNSRS